MAIRQLSLWDNVAAETGFQHLIALDFTRAALEFNASQVSPIQIDPSVAAGKQACNYWQPRIDPWQTTDAPPEMTTLVLTNLLHDYSKYSFKWLNSFSAHLFRYLAQLVQEFLQDLAIDESTDTSGEGICPDAIYSLIRNLLSLCYEEVERTAVTPKVLKILVHKFPEDGRLLYLLAEAHDKCASRELSKQCYAESLLNFPLHLPEDLQMPEDIAELMQKFGPIKAIIYGAIKGALPCPEPAASLQFSSESLQNELDTLRAYRAAEIAYKEKDLNKSIQHRKELLKLDSELCQLYLAQIKQREQRGGVQSA